MPIPSWLIIGLIALVVVQISNLTTPEGRRWFNRLRRPPWLTFEWAIPLIWTTIVIFGVWSAYLVWETAQSWPLMGGYLLVEVTIMSYTPLMCNWKSLLTGTLIGATGTLFGAILALLVFPVNPTATLLLVPYLLWSPIGTYVTWEMIRLNPNNA
ncbi:TspO/MBR family protein [Spirulina subsalsa]|uniref:TspO/MBR family protein n=1 Tax=Spirulina subsalsa TaxID=54311 RepID=UPI0002E41C94|nr:TspO/MBR family protein [Spirulina subsalsa]